MNDKKLKDMWKTTEKFHGASGYQKENIERFISGGSVSVAHKIRKMLHLDIGLKLIVSFILIIDIIIYLNIQMNIALTCIAALAVLLSLVYLEFKMLSKFNDEADFGQNTKKSLSKMLVYLKSKFYSCILAISSTYVFVFLAGSLVYFYVEYGKLRPLDGTDITIFLVFIIIGVILNYVVNSGQVKYYVKHLETCLTDLNGGVLKAVLENIEQQRKKDRIVKLLLTLALVFGFVVLIVVLTNFGMLK